MTRFTDEIAEKYQVRKSRKQKEAFRKKITDKFLSMGYPVGEERHGLFSSVVNVTVGDPDKAEVIFTAHYDTQAVMPFPNFITPRRPIIYWGYQILIAVVMVILAVALQTAVYWLTENTPLSMAVYFLFLIGFLGLMVAGPANKHTKNDNTSGVCVLCEALQSLTPEEIKEGKAAFVFFDCEELGLIGSSCYASRHKKALKNQTVVNFDCVGDGDHFLFICSKLLIKEEKAQKLAAFIENHPETVNTVCSEKGVVYPSDQKVFKRSIGVAAFHEKKRLGLYMGRIHTKRDTVLEERNVELLCRFIRNVIKKS